LAVDMVVNMDSAVKRKAKDFRQGW
jgi:hypothetical protein